MKKCFQLSRLKGTYHRRYPQNHLDIIGYTKSKEVGRGYWSANLPSNLTILVRVQPAAKSCWKETKINQERDRSWLIFN